MDVKIVFRVVRGDWSKTIGTCLLAMTISGTSAAQHSDISIFQDVQGVLASVDRGTGLLENAFVRSFDFFGHPFGNPGIPKAFVGDDPGFQMTGLDAPVDLSPLPATTALQFRLLPVRLPDGQQRNLFYWNALAGEVSFGAVPANHAILVTDDAGTTHTLDGSMDLFDGMVAGVTDGNGGLHEHPTYRLDDRDENINTDPATGAYMFAVRATMQGLQESAPFFVVLTSPEVPSATENSIASWLRSNLSQIVPLDGLRGDFDSNGVLNATDIDALVEQVANGMHAAPFDLNGDGFVTNADVSIWVVDLFGTLPGDANLDRVVDGSDFGAWNSNKFTAIAAWTHGDFSANGQVDGSDFGIWNANKFRSATDGSVVPEPHSTFVVFEFLFVICLFAKRMTR